MDVSERKNGKKKVVVILGLLVIILIAVWVWFAYQNEHYIVTEDAKVDAAIVKVSPQINGKIQELDFEENQIVEANQILGRQADDALPAGANVDLAVLRAPVGGQVVKKLASAGEIGTVGNPVALMVDVDELYVTANIEEDKIEKVEVGQEVRITVDSFPDVWFMGKVDSIGSASTSTFSLLSTQTSGNTFIKVTQRIPVKIIFQKKYEEKLLPGMNSYVKIYL